MSDDAALHDPLLGPLPGHTQWGDAALFEDEAGEVVARMVIAPALSVPVLVVADPVEHAPHKDYTGVVARHPLLGAPEREAYRGWDDSSFRDLCDRLGIDPDKQRPTFDAWCRDLGEELLECAMVAFENYRWAEQGAANGAIVALQRGARPRPNGLGEERAGLRDIGDAGLRERAREALEQLERSADWKEALEREKEALEREEAEAMRRLIGGTLAVGPGGLVVIRDVDDPRLGGRPTLSERVRRWFR